MKPVRSAEIEHVGILDSFIQRRRVIAVYDDPPVIVDADVATPWESQTSGCASQEKEMANRLGGPTPDENADKQKPP